MKIRKPNGQIRKEYGSEATCPEDLRDRTTHTGQQPADTVSGIPDVIATTLVPSGNLSMSWDPETQKVTVAALGMTAYNLGDIVISQTAIVAISAGIRSLTISGVTGAVTSDRVSLFPVSSLPSGYAIHNAIVTSAGVIQVTLSAPLLNIGASYSITCAVKALR